MTLCWINVKGWPCVYCRQQQTMAQIWPTTCVYNKVLLGHSHAHLFTYSLLLLSYHCKDTE